MKWKIFSYLPMRVIFSVAILSFSVSDSFSQLPSEVQSQINKLIPQPVPKSPNVAQFEKFGDYKVNYFSGLPDIQIPIFTITSGDLSVPISISYHASGVKPTDVASWVGMGWSLSAGGQISRSVAGKPDEEYFYTSTLNPSPSSCNTFYYLKDAANRVIDTEPDVFSYSWPGKSGKFILSQNGESPYLVPFEPIKVNPTYAQFNQTNSFYFPKFEITDQEGVLYRFGTNSTGSSSSTEYTSAVNGGAPTLNATTAWHLMDIVSPNSDNSISFNYQPVGVSTTHDVSYSYTIMDLCFRSLGADGVPVPPCPSNSDIIGPVINSNSTVNQQGIQSITYKTGRVDFVLGSTRLDKPDLKYLDRIDVYSFVNGSYKLLKSCKFVYSYFSNLTGGSEALKLDKVQFLGNTGTVIEEFKFEYFTNSFSWDRNHPNFLNARDLWGYYNGALQNTDLVLPKTITYQPTVESPSGNLTFGGAIDRSVNAQFAKEGVLKRITFPTGGYTEFSFESNQYLNNTTPTLCGGLRVTKVDSFSDLWPQPIVKTYKYGFGESGMGLPNFNTYQFNYNATSWYEFIRCPASEYTLQYQIRSYFSNSALNQDSFDSSPVRYAFVTEYTGDYQGQNLGKIIYEYDNGQPPGDNDLVLGPSGKFYRNSMSWRRGKLTRRTVYDPLNNKLAEDYTEYAELKSTDKTIGLLAHQFVTGRIVGCGASNVCTNEANESANSLAFKFTFTSQKSGAYVETKRIETKYQVGSSTAPFVSQTLTSYEGEKVQPSQVITSSGSYADQKVTVMRYPFQLAANALSTGPAQGIYMLNSKNIVSNPVETYSYLQSVGGSNQRMISGQVSTYVQSSANLNYVVPGQIFLLEPPANLPLSSYQPITINANNSGLTIDPNQKLRASFLQYDYYGNLQSLSKTNDVGVSYLYGYNNTLPIAEIQNALAGECFFSSFEENGVSFIDGNGTNQARTGNRVIMASTFTFPVEYAPNESNTLMSYWYWQNNKWNFSGAMPFQRTINTTGSYLDDVRAFPKNAQMTTYTYLPQVGITTQANPNDFVTYYEYDEMNRLKLIRDNDKKIVKTYKYTYKK